MKILLMIILLILSCSIVISADVWDRPNQFQNVTINVTNNYYYNQTYNDTAIYYMINVLNGSLTGQINELNNTINIINTTGNIQMLGFNTTNELYNIFYTQNNPLGFINWTNATNSFYPLHSNPNGYINNSLKPNSPYFYNDSLYFYFNETKLNQTINNISKINKYINTIYCNVQSGICQNISIINVSYLITEIKVMPINNNTIYRFEATEDANNIDTNRIPHKGVWDIEKNYAINNQVQINITSNNDELFTTQIIYIKNGVE